MKNYSFGKDFDEEERSEASAKNKLDSVESAKEKMEALRKMNNILRNDKPLNNPYGSVCQDDFDSKIDSMNLHELQRMCVETVIPPSGTRPFLKRKLKASFAKFLVKNKDRLGN